MKKDTSGISFTRKVVILFIAAMIMCSLAGCGLKMDEYYYCKDSGTLIIFRDNDKCTVYMTSSRAPTIKMTNLPYHVDDDELQIDFLTDIGGDPLLYDIEDNGKRIVSKDTGSEYEIISSEEAEDLID